MNNWNITLLESVNNLKFGMSRENIRSLLNSNYVEFKKSNFSKNTTDDFGFCHIFYTINNEFEAIEIFVNNDTSIEINNEPLSPLTVENLKSLPYNFLVEEDGAISSKYSIGIYAPEKVVQSIIFAKDNYYDI